MQKSKVPVTAEELCRAIGVDPDIASRVVIEADSANRDVLATVRIEGYLNEAGKDRLAEAARAGRAAGKLTAAESERLERYATAAMAGIIAMMTGKQGAANVAKEAVAYARAMVAELDAAGYVPSGPSPAEEFIGG